MYYLQSRYYNPEWGRFINIDAMFGEVGDILSHNLYTYCLNNPINMDDSNGFRPIYSTDLDNETDAMRQYSFSTMKELGYQKWKYRWEPGSTSSGEREHVHLEGGGKIYQQDIEGKRRTKQNSPGDPPKKAKEALKEKEGWDWDANAAKAKKIVGSGSLIAGGGYVTYRAIRMLPSLLPPLWPTIPGNLAIP